MCLFAGVGEKKDVWKEKKRRAATTTTKREKALHLKAPKTSKCRHVATKNNGPCACSMRKTKHRPRLVGSHCVFLLLFTFCARGVKGVFFQFFFSIWPILDVKRVRGVFTLDALHSFGGDGTCLFRGPPCPIGLPPLYKEGRKGHTHVPRIQKRCVYM